MIPALIIWLIRWHRQNRGSYKNSTAEFKRSTRQLLLVKMLLLMAIVLLWASGIHEPVEIHHSLYSANIILTNN
ncbi:MAG TPA: hypothetical protein VGQ09_14135 [Chitinophagaceae bacterium]|jgi:hypothetical protein|nr:hypothetical protein [Chitinophagaceae bacterium]